MMKEFLTFIIFKEFKSMKIELSVDTAKIDKSVLDVELFLLLAYLRETSNLEIKYYRQDMLKELENFGYIRIINDEIIIDSMTEGLFGSSVPDAEDLLDYYNALKEKYLKVSRKSFANKYIVKFKSLLLHYSKEDIEKTLEYLFKEWSKDNMMKKYLLSIDTIHRHFDKYLLEMEMNGKKKTIKQSRLI